VKLTKAPNGADRGKYNAYQREYKRRKRMARRDGNGAVDDLLHGVRDIVRPGAGGVDSGDCAGDNGVGRETAELGDVSRL